MDIYLLTDSLNLNSAGQKIKDNNDNTWLLGRVNGINLTAGNGATGTAQGDRSGYTLTFSANEKELSPAVASGVFTALTTPG